MLRKGDAVSPVRAHKEMLSFFKKVLFALGQIVAAIVLLFALVACYGFFAERSAEKKSAAMCASIKPGQNSAPLLDIALADGASEFQSRWAKTDGVDALYIAYVGFTPLSRYVCLVQAKDGRVVSVREIYLD